MVRGKYTTRAAGVRAERAELTAEQLKAALGAERKRRVEEVGQLKAEIQQLQSQLVREVGNLSQAEVERVRREAQDAIEAERQAACDRSRKAVKLLDRLGVNLGIAAWAELDDVLGLTPGEALGVSGIDANRHARRASVSRAKHIATLKAQGRSF